MTPSRAGRVKAVKPVKAGGVAVDGELRPFATEQLEHGVFLARAYKGRCIPVLISPVKKGKRK